MRRTPKGGEIAFVHAGDIWIAAPDGSNPVRLTSHPADERDPVFSPDGTKIAYTANYDGNADVFVIDVRGGEPKRLTWHPGDDTAIACCVSAMEVGKQMQFFGARVNLAKTLLYAINGGRDEVSGKQIAPVSPPAAGEVLDYDDVAAKFDKMMDWLAETYVDALNCVHFMHDKYAYERIEMAQLDKACDLYESLLLELCACT